MRAILALILLAWGAGARADELRPGFIELRQRDAVHWSLGWKQPLVTPMAAEAPAPLVPTGCRALGAPVQRVARLAVVGSRELACTGALTGARVGYREIVGGGDVLFRYAPVGGEPQSLRLTAERPFARIAAAEAPRNVWRTYGILGFEHILAGWDHLLFVVALVLLVGRGWQIAGAVTAFTVAHSLTLAGVTLGLVGLPPRAVEAVIALSIVFLAAELLRPDHAPARRWPWAVAFAFGLIHGFGFAGALADIGFPPGEVPAALIAFNLGVEAGQLLVVGAVLALVAAIDRFAVESARPAVRLAAYGIGVTASYWLVERLAA